MSVSSITTDSTTYTTTAGTTTLGKEDFLTILVAQLENQDPLDPQDSSQFVSQMAQFSSLEQQITTNENLETLIASASNSEQYAAFQLLGSQIVVDSDSFTYSGDAVEIGFELDTAADAIQISVLDADNTVVATLDVGQADAGTTFVTWDGTNDAGETVDAGTYSFVISGSDDATARVRTTVQQISVESSGSVLVTGAGEFGISDVTSVANS